jgi:hypothetical protein
MDLDSPESIEVTCLLLGRVIVDVVLAEATSIQLCEQLPERLLGDTEVLLVCCVAAGPDVAR